MEMNQEVQKTNLPRIGEPAPAFKAVTTQGEIDFPEQYKGSWVILFSHPADFTPVCTTEFMTFAAMMPQFDALNCKLVGLSIDSNYSHIAWLRTIKEKIQYKGMTGLEVTFPVIADLKMEVARLYGMLQPSADDSHAVRAVFIIDAQATVRAVLYYPLSTGRNFTTLSGVFARRAFGFFSSGGSGADRATSTSERTVRLMDTSVASKVPTMSSPPRAMAAPICPSAARMT